MEMRIRVMKARMRMRTMVRMRTRMRMRMGVRMRTRMRVRMWARMWARTRMRARARLRARATKMETQFRAIPVPQEMIQQSADQATVLQSLMRCFWHIQKVWSSIDIEVCYILILHLIPQHDTIQPDPSTALEREFDSITCPIWFDTSPMSRNTPRLPLTQPISPSINAQKYGMQVVYPSSTPRVPYFVLPVIHLGSEACFMKSSGLLPCGRQARSLHHVVIAYTLQNIIQDYRMDYRACSSPMSIYFFHSSSTISRIPVHWSISSSHFEMNLTLTPACGFSNRIVIKMATKSLVLFMLNPLYILHIYFLSSARPLFSHQLTTHIRLMHIRLSMQISILTTMPLRSRFRALWVIS